MMVRSYADGYKTIMLKMAQAFLDQLWLQKINVLILIANVDNLMIIGKTLSFVFKEIKKIILRLIKKENAQQSTYKFLNKIMLVKNVINF